MLPPSEMKRPPTTPSDRSCFTHILLVIFNWAPDKGNDAHLVILALTMFQSQLENNSCVTSRSWSLKGKEIVCVCMCVKVGFSMHTS